MVGRWKLLSFQLCRVLFFMLMFNLNFDECMSINLEGAALLQFRARVETDPYGIFANWNASDNHPCMWSGVHCVDGEVKMLDLRELSLRGMLAPELGKLSHLRSLVLRKNNFSGDIPKEIAGLTMLELLDLRGNNLTGTIPVEIAHMLSLKHLLLCDNKFQESIPSEFGKLNMLFDLQYGQNLTSDVANGIGCINRKVRHWFNFRKDSLHDYEEKCFDSRAGLTESHIVQNAQHVLNLARHMLLQENRNLPAAPITVVPNEELVTIPSFGSGSFPAIPNSPGENGKKQFPVPAWSPSEGHHIPPSPSVPLHRKSSPTSTPANSIAMLVPSHTREWKYVLVLSGGAFLALTVVVLFMCRSRTRATIGPCETGLSCQLQNAFVTGVPQLNRAELEIACEDFSNIIGTLPACTIFKGTLSSGVEVAVASTCVASSIDWSNCSEIHFRKKVNTFSRLNHKNFVNLLGYCEEDEPFLRMMVLEYASNGTLFEHLHVKEVECLDWPARVRIIMGVAYCLQYMHHELNPPISHPNLTSSSIFLSDDYAAKIGEFSFWEEFVAKGKISGDDDTNPSKLPLPDLESNVYNFGVLLLEIISGKLHYSEKEGSLVNWAIENLNDKCGSSYIIDSQLQSFKDNELDVIREVIQACIHEDPRQRPMMMEVTSKLRKVIPISPEAASPRLSPLWWAELEILSVEAG